MGGGADEARILRERARHIAWFRRYPALPTSGKLLLRNEQLQPTPRDIDGDAVALNDECDGAAL